MMDVAIAYNRYKFLGHEFLTWLWYMIENEPDAMVVSGSGPVPLVIGNRLVLENRMQEGVETVTIKGDSAGLEEGLLCLRKGGMVTQMNLVYTDGLYEWSFTVKGENLDFGCLKTPDTGKVESKEDVEGALIEKMGLYEKVFKAVDGLFAMYVNERLSDSWQNVWTPRIYRWISGKPVG